MLGLAWKSLGWFLASVAVALGFLLVPLQVAAERKKLDRTAGDIVRAKRDIRALETEFDTRANLAQLDRWNAESLGLVSPAADQFVADEAALAAIQPTNPQAPQMASFVPAGPTQVSTGQQAVAAVSAQPAVAAAPAVPAPRAVSAPVARPVAAPPVRAALAAVAPPRPRAAVAMLDRALLDDSVIGDLRSAARAETVTHR